MVGILPPQRGSIFIFLLYRGLRSSLRDSCGLHPRTGPATATRFHIYIPPYRGLRARRWRPLHPRLGYRHRYAIQTVLPPLHGSIFIFPPYRGLHARRCYPWVTCTPLAFTPPMAGVPPSLRDSKGPTTATRFDIIFLHYRGLHARLWRSLHPGLGYRHRYAIHVGCTHDGDTVIATRFFYCENYSTH